MAHLDVALGDGVTALGIKTCKLDARQWLVNVVVNLVDEPHGMVHSIVAEHDGRDALAVVRRDQTIEVAGLHDGAQQLVVGKRLCALVVFLLAHVSRLQLHAQTSAHGHVAAELDGDDTAARVPIRRAADVLCHCVGREEVGGPVLDINALQGIVVVAHPELVEVGQQAIVGTATTRGTVLHDQVRILGADALEHVDESAVPQDGDVVLLVLGQV